MWGEQITPGKWETQHSETELPDRHIPFARPQFGRAYSLLCTRKDVSDSEGSQWVLLFPLVSQGCGAEVQYEEEAIEQAPGAQQLEVLEVLLRKDKTRHQQGKPHQTEGTCTPNASYLTTSATRVADGLSNHVVDLKLSEEQRDIQYEQVRSSSQV